MWYIGGCHAVVRINHSFCFNTLILTFINSVTYLNCNNVEFLINKVLDVKLLVSLLIKYAISLTNSVYFYFYYYLFFCVLLIYWALRVLFEKNFIFFLNVLDWNFTTTNINLWTWLKNEWIWPQIDWFLSYSPINVHCCGNIYYIFGHIHHVNVRHCQFFGHVHQIRSYSFGYLDWVKWINPH